MNKPKSLYFLLSIARCPPLNKKSSSNIKVQNRIYQPYRIYRNGGKFVIEIQH